MSFTLLAFLAWAGIACGQAVQFPGASPGTDQSFTKPLDVVGSAVAAYSFRNLRAAYAGSAVQFNRAADSIMQDCGFTANGNFDKSCATRFCTSTCTVRTFYDQSGNANNLTQAIKANQATYVDAGSLSGQPVARWCSTCGYSAADSATYKTDNIHGFFMAKWGLAGSAAPESWYLLGYPSTTSSTIGASRWALTSPGVPDYIQFEANGGNENWGGLGAAYRNRLYQYEFRTASRVTRINAVNWADGTNATPITYPNAVGLYLGMNALGRQNPLNMDFAELLLYGSASNPVVSNRNSDTLAANQTAYWTTVPPATASTPDGFKWSPYYTGMFNSNGGPLAGSPVTVNSIPYYVEGALDTYSVWRATNGSNASSLWRFELRRWDRDGFDSGGGAERAEIDPGTASTWGRDLTIQISYAVFIEAGPGPTRVSWNIHGQYHTGTSGSACCIFHVGFEGGAFKFYQDSTTVVHTTSAITRGAWYDIFVEVKVSSDNVSDILKVWLNGSQVVNNSGNLFTKNGTHGGYMKFGLYRGFPGDIAQAEAVRYANMEVTNKAVTDLTSRIASPLPHPSFP